MSINPVQPIGSIPAAQSAPSNRRTAQRPSGSSVRPASGPVPKRESLEVPNASLSAELPQDAVELQRDRESGGEIVVRYLDHSGNLILQVPSDQVLGMARAISREVEQEQKRVPRTAESAEIGGKSNGH